jgi:hypothetical protein
MTRATSTRRLANSSCDVTRFNALRHGLLSRFTVLPGEDENQYSDLLNALVTEHKPLGPTEEHLVEELAGIIWRKRRLGLAEGAAWRRGLTGAPSRETTEAALAPLNLFEKEAANVGKQRADLAQDGASIAHALELLHAGKTRCYDKALSNLGETTRERWMKRPDQSRLSNCLISAAQVFLKMPMDSCNFCRPKLAVARPAEKNLRISR